MTRRARPAPIHPDAAFLPNAIALVRSHLAAHVNTAARLVPNRPAWARPHIDGEMTPAEIWQIAESFVDAQQWSNKGEVLAKLRETLKVQVGWADGAAHRTPHMVLLTEANAALTAASPYAGGE